MNRFSKFSWAVCCGLLATCAARGDPVVPARRALGTSGLAVHCATNRVGRYELLDFTLDVPGAYTNSFDPDEVRVDLRLTAPSGSVVTVPAFWYQDYAKSAAGAEPRATGAPYWAGRFAPTELGTYEAEAVLKNRQGTSHSGRITFTCVPSSSSGFVRISKRDPRFLEFSDGRPFFPIGQNLAFIGRQQYVTPPKVDRVFSELADNGANYLRVWTCCEDWALSIESPDRGLVTVGFKPLDCYRLDQVVSIAQQHGLFLQLCLLTRDRYLGALHRPDSPEYSQAERTAEKTLRYVVARWGYATTVAAWEYWNEMDPGLPTDRFYTEVGDYLERTDPYHHLRTTSAWGPSAKDCHHLKLDIADLHFYLRPSERDRLQDEVDAVVERTAWLRRQAPKKPAQLAEFGLADEKWRLTPEMKTSPELADVHNALWASALSGASGTVLPWWWERLHQHHGYEFYRPLSRFLTGIPWNSGEVRSLQRLSCTSEGVFPIGLCARDRAWVWLFSRDASWKRLVLQGSTPRRIAGAELEIGDWSPGTCRVRWWNTFSGAMVREETISSGDQPLRLPVPEFTRDIACSITER